MQPRSQAAGQNKANMNRRSLSKNAIDRKVLRSTNDCIYDGFRVLFSVLILCYLAGIINMID